VNAVLGQVSSNHATHMTSWEERSEITHYCVKWDKCKQETGRPVLRLKVEVTRSKG